MESVFVCHSSADAIEAMNLAQALEAKGSPCWIAPRDIPAGADYPHEIVTGIQRTEAFLILLSPAAVRSKHILRELELAASAGKRILPVRCGRVELNPSMTFLLAGVQWIEVTEDELRRHPHRIAERILEGQGTRLEKTASRGVKLPAVALSGIAFAGLLAAGWAAWASNGGSDGPASAPEPAARVGVSPAPEAMLVKPAAGLPGVPVASSLPPEESVAPDEAPKAIPLGLPEGRWACVGEAAYLIEWDMTFSGDPEQLKLTGHKSRVNRKKAQPGERNTTLTLEGRLEHRKWTGSYAEARKTGTETGTFEAEFSEDFEEFTARIFTKDGRASSPLVGKIAR